MILLILIAAAVTAYFQITSLIKERFWRDLVVFCIFWTLAVVLSVLYALGIHLPDPMKVMQRLFDALGLSF